MALPTENPHSRRKPGSTYPAAERLKNGSRLSPGMRILWHNVLPEQNVPNAAERLNADDPGISVRSSFDSGSKRDAAGQRNCTGDVRGRPILDRDHRLRADLPPGHRRP